MRSQFGQPDWQFVEHVKLSLLLLPHNALPSTTSGYVTNNISVLCESLLEGMLNKPVDLSACELSPPTAYPPFCYHCKRIAETFCPICPACSATAPLTADYFYRASWALTLICRSLTPLHQSRQQTLEAAVRQAHSRWMVRRSLPPSARLPTKAIAPLSRTSTPPATLSLSDSTLALARSRLTSLRQSAS